MTSENSFDSTEERWFSYYLEELDAHGFIHQATYHPTSFRLSEHQDVKILQIVAGKVKDKEVKLIGEHIYTADWRIDWTPQADGVFFWKIGGAYKGNYYPYNKKGHNDYLPFIKHNGSTYIDVKGGFNGRNNNSATTFSLNQKWTYQLLDELVQKCVISLDDKCLFYRTFTPKKVIEEVVYKSDYLNKKSKVMHKKGESKIKFECRTIDEYLKIKKVKR